MLRPTILVSIKQTSALGQVTRSATFAHAHPPSYPKSYRGNCADEMHPFHWP